MITESLRASITTESTGKITKIIRAQAPHYLGNLAGHPDISIQEVLIMDIASITAAYSGLKVAKDIFSGLNNLKVEAATIEKINEAVKKVADAQDTLFDMREELFRLQSENSELTKTIAESDNWDNKLSEYSLVKTSGGAVVYKFNGDPEHYICPSCVSKKSIEILQDNRTYSGKYRCVNCKAEYPIDPQKKPPQRKIISRGV